MNVLFFVSSCAWNGVGPDGGDGGSDADPDSGAEVTTDTHLDPMPAIRPDHVVCPDGSGDHVTLQDAIDVSLPGDLVHACPGTYDPIVVPWSFDVTIVATDGPDVTVIDGGAGPAVIVDSGTLALSGFEIRGAALDDPWHPEGAALSVHEGDLTVSDCRIVGTTGAFTLLFDENYLAMEDVVWEDNTTNYLWYLAEGTNADILHNTVRGGQHQTVLTTPDLDNALIANNLFVGVRIDRALTAFDLFSNGLGTLRVTNNVFDDVDDDDPWGGRTLDLDGVDFRNNIVTRCDGWNLFPMAASYSIFWDNGVDYAPYVTGTGNLFVDPELADPDAEDYSLLPGSPAIDAGDPALDDPDGSRSDIGLHGGPYEATASAIVSDPDDEEAPVLGATPRTLTVTDGYGDGAYRAGEEVFVWADVDPQSEIVTGWSGATVTAPEWSTTLIMPDHDVTLTPTLVAAELPLTERFATLGGQARSILEAIPPNPRGIVLFFHSELGNNAELRDNAASSIARRLYEEGLAIVAMDSDIAAIAGTGGWSDALDDETLDLAGVRELWDELGYWDTPLIAWGMGSGADFAHAVGVALPADAVVSYCSPGRRFLVDATSAPTAWFMADWDSVYPTGGAEATAYAAALEARGVTAEAHIHGTTPLYEERFSRVAGVDAARAATIAARLRTRGYVDAEDRWRVTGEVAAEDLEGLGLSAEEEVGVRREIWVMAADHAMFDEEAAAMLGFLEGVVR